MRRPWHNILYRATYCFNAWSFTVKLPEDGPNGPKHVGVLKYIINIRKVHSLEVITYICIKMHGKHSIKKAVKTFILLHVYVVQRVYYCICSGLFILKHCPENEYNSIIIQYLWGAVLVMCVYILHFCVLFFVFMSTLETYLYRVVSVE